MASSSQRRCVFVGNIPYDATEEQLIEICREVGPVVSFRLVIDRETGKPKGYGFCEYKDEETALSARRNLQGYEINGRQLRVDFAENDKGSDRNREQGHGGPCMPSTAEPQKQIGGPMVPGDSNIHQPIGLHLAITAASVMAGALGGPQAGLQPAQSTLQAPASDPLTLHLAKMSRSQLSEIVAALKLMALQNKEQARQLLLSRPQLLKAIFQAQIMLGIVTPQVLQMPNIVQAPRNVTWPSVQDAQQPQQLATQSLPSLPPLSQKAQPLIRPQHSQLSIPQPPSKQAFVQITQGIPQQPAQPGPSGFPTISSGNPPSVRTQIQMPSSSLSQTPLVQRQVQGAVPVPVSTSLAYSSQMALPNNAVQSSLLPLPPLSSSVQQQGGRAVSSGFSNIISIDSSVESISRPSKMIKVRDGRNTSFLGPGASQQEYHQEKRAPQTHLAPDVQSALLEQVLNLTPEQLSSLTPEQRQEVIKLQQALRQDQMQPS